MENQTLGWTSLEQSKRLVEAGLNPYTADMYYYDKDEIPRIFFIKEAEMSVKSKMKTTKLYNPCWSLGKLISLMPKSIPHGDELLIFVSKDKYNVGYFSFIDRISYDVTHNEIEDTMIDSVVKNIVYLLNNGYIKKAND